MLSSKGIFASRIKNLTLFKVESALFHFLQCEAKHEDGRNGVLGNAEMIGTHSLSHYDLRRICCWVFQMNVKLFRVRRPSFSRGLVELLPVVSG